MGDTTGSYTASYLNRFDLIFVVLAILIFAFETVFHPFMIAEQIDTFVFIARYISQLYRVARLVMQERDSRMVKNLEPISICFDNESFADKFHWFYFLFLLPIPKYIIFHEQKDKEQSILESCLVA